MHAAHRAFFCIPLLWLILLATAPAQDDPGKAKLGQVCVTVYYATNGDPAAGGAKAAKVSAKTQALLRSKPQLDFKNYRVLGADTQALLRSYESWAQPLKPSDEILVRFEARSLPTATMTQLDLELWLSRKKILKTDARLQGNRALFILGPEWRGGRLIVTVGLADDEKSGTK